MQIIRYFFFALPIAASIAFAEEPEWAGTLERISTGVVSIRVDSTRAFDTEWNSSSQATGFVVDAERGLILTNRHVVTPGPVVAEAICFNNEEVRLTPVYRDPVHDFGFFRYDPDDLFYMEPAELSVAGTGCCHPIPLAAATHPACWRPDARVIAARQVR